MITWAHAMEVFQKGLSACSYDLHQIKCLMKSPGAMLVSASIAFSLFLFLALGDLLIVKRKKLLQSQMQQSKAVSITQTGGVSPLTGVEKDLRAAIGIPLCIKNKTLGLILLGCSMTSVSKTKQCQATLMGCKELHKNVNNINACCHSKAFSLENKLIRVIDPT